VAAHCAAWCAALSGEQDSVRRWLAVVEAGELDGPLPDGMPSLAFSAALLRGVFGFDGIRVMRESAAAAAESGTDPASPWYALAKTALGAAMYLSGEFDAAFAQLSDAMQGNASLAVVRLLGCSVMALVAVERGRLGQARELAAAARAIADGDHSDAPRSAIAYTASGAVEAMQGHLVQARGYFEHALHAGRRCSGMSPWVVLDTMLRLTPVLCDLSDPAGAADLLGQARAVLASRPDGAKPQLIRAEQLALRLASRKRPQPLAEALTEREAEVLRLLRGTLSLREIGQELFLSANTIKTHSRAIYRKLGVCTRQEAVERGHQMGIL
jgi:LuxR family maltose regulon positive regulatory protein